MNPSQAILQASSLLRRHCRDRSMPTTNQSSSSGEGGLRAEAIAWVIRLRNQHLSPEERQAFEAWHAQSPVHAKMYKNVSEIWDDPELHGAAIEAARTEMPSRARPRPAISRWFGYGLAVAACAILMWMAAFEFDLITKWQADFSTVVGERRMIELPDHSTVMLNTDTAIAMAFDEQGRRIRLLKGEASFKVQSDPDRPFLVESTDTTTRAVGTEFIVRAGSMSDRVTVVEGTVEVANRRTDEQTKRLSAGFQVEMQTGRLGDPRPVDLYTVAAWRRGRLVVNGAPLEQVINDVRRYHPGMILLWNRDLASTQVTGTYNLEEPSKILALLTKTFPLRSVAVTDRFIVLY